MLRADPALLAVPGPAGGGRSAGWRRADPALLAVPGPAGGGRSARWRRADPGVSLGRAVMTAAGPADGIRADRRAAEAGRPWTPPKH